MKAQALILCLLPLVLSALTVQERFSGPAYNAQTAQQKLDQLWTEITADTKSLGWYSVFTQLGIFTESASVTFDTYSDVFPVGRKLLTHTTGAVAKVEFIPEKSSPYTGVFQGTDTAILRFATATESHPKKAPWTNFNPAFALKILRDNVPSANILAMFTAEGQNSWNPFSEDWSNHIPHPTTMKIRALSYKFSSATPYPGRLGLKDVAQFDKNGKEFDRSTIKLPFRLIFSPNVKVAKMFPDTFSELLADQVKRIPVGTDIYDVYAIEKPYADAVKIGTIRSKTLFTTSKFGDQYLFFKHSYMEDDIAINFSFKAGAEVEPPIPYKKV